MTLPLDTFREIISYSPWHFWQMADANYTPITSNCNTVVLENAWINAGQSGRADIKRAIENAERLLTDYLDYPPYQKQITETIDLSCGIDGINQSYYHQYFPFSVPLKYGKVSQIATETFTNQGDFALSFTDEFGTGLEDTFILDYPDTTTTDFTNITVYFSQSDRFGTHQNDDSYWKIEPVVITRLNSTTVRIQGRKWLIGLPKNYQRYGPHPGYNYAQYGVNSAGALDPTVSTNFSGTLQLNTRTLATNSVNLITDNCGTLTTTALCATVLDSNAGVIQVTGGGSGVCACDCYAIYSGWRAINYPPVIQRLQVTYIAGEEIEDWQTTIARLALAELQPRICACEQANYEIRRWQRDMSYRGSPDEAYYIDTNDLKNPIGNKLGHIYAWKQIKNRRRLLGNFIG